jgi:ribosome-binding factor A
VKGAGPPRRVRVAEAMRKNLAEMLEREVRDPRLHEAGIVSVNHVELNRDMSVARVYVSFYGGPEEAAPEAVSALGRAAGRLRGPVARRINLKRAPELRFEHDTSPELRQRISEIVHEDEQAREAGDEGDESDEGDEAEADD